MSQTAYSGDGCDKIALRVDGSKQADTTFVLAHGAGAGMDSEFMEFFADRLAGPDLRVVRFEFPYMATRRVTGIRRPPDRELVLRQTWHSVVQSLNSPRLFLGGKSMGGRIATLIARDLKVAGLICLGYPFHPANKTDKLRIEHLRDLTIPTLILQGERDTFGSRSEVAGYELSPHIQLAWLPDGDHSFTPRKASGRSLEDNWEEAASKVCDFLHR